MKLAWAILIGLFVVTGVHPVEIKMIRALDGDDIPAYIAFVTDELVIGSSDRGYDTSLRLLSDLHGTPFFRTRKPVDYYIQVDRSAVIFKDWDQILRHFDTKTSKVVVLRERDIPDSMSYLFLDSFSRRALWQFKEGQPVLMNYLKGAHPDDYRQIDFGLKVLFGFKENTPSFYFSDFSEGEVTSTISGDRKDRGIFVSGGELGDSRRSFKFLAPRVVVGGVDPEEPRGELRDWYYLKVIDDEGNVSSVPGISSVLYFDVSPNGKWLVVNAWNPKVGTSGVYLFQVNLSAEVVEQGVRLRDRGGVSGKIIRTLEKGERVTITEHTWGVETIDGQTECWYKIQTGKSETGWVFGAFLKYW